MSAVLFHGGKRKSWSEDLVASSVTPWAFYVADNKRVVFIWIGRLKGRMVRSVQIESQSDGDNPAS